MCADFEDSSNPQEKFYSFSPVPIDMLPKFKLCHPIYWKEQREIKAGTKLSIDPNEDVAKVKNRMLGMFKG